jgi:hypothetical protein
VHHTPQRGSVGGSSTDPTQPTGLILPLGLSDCDAPIGSVPRQVCDTRGQNVTNDELAALERFLKSLTDPRVQCDQAPFDHPQLKVFNGHLEADDVTFALPAVGAAGYTPKLGYCIPNAGDLFAPGMQARSGGLKAKIQ